MKRPSFNEVFSTGFFSIEATDQTFSYGQPYYRFCHADSAIVCVIDKSGSFILVRQFRPNLGCYTIEFPAGAVDEGEAPFEAASREFLEETGMRCDLLQVGQYRVMMNRTKNIEHAFFGVDAVQVASEKHEDGIEVLAVPRSEFVDRVLSSAFQQVTAIGVLQVASLHLGVDIINGETSEIVDKFHVLCRKESLSDEGL